MSTLFGPQASNHLSQNRDPSDDRWYGTAFGGPVAAGVGVTPDAALQVSAVYACIQVIAQSIASLPVKIYREQGNGDKREDREHPLYDLLHDSPNTDQTAYEFKYMMGAHLACYGNSINELKPGRRGFADQIVPIHPDCVTPRKTPGGEVIWQINDGKGPRELSSDRVWHIRGTPFRAPDGIRSISPLDMERQAVGDAMASRDYSARFWANDGTPPSWIEHPSHFKDDESRKNFIRAWKAAQGGKNRHSTAVLEHGMQLKSISISNEQAQFLDTRKYQDVDIARIYRVPPHKIGILDRATFSNIEQQSIEFVVDTLTPWLVCIEQAIKKDLILSKGVFAEFNVAALLRGDILSRYQAYAIGRNWGWLSANDVRRMENKNSIGSDGDEYLRPTNMTPADSPAEPSGQGQPPNNRQAIKAAEE
ncbi:phage portal protein [Algiphilus sp.]|uniref:phage portal protein n=1 Tax=Algiphilus sp. TaxID=1872431 RepID=UPI003CCBAFC3